MESVCFRWALPTTLLWVTAGLVPVLSLLLKGPLQPEARLPR